MKKNVLKTTKYTVLSSLMACTTFVTTSTFAQTPTAFADGINIAITKPGYNGADRKYVIYSNPTTNTGLSTFTTIDSLYNIYDNTNNNYDFDGIGLNPNDHFVYGTSFNFNNSIYVATGVAGIKAIQDVRLTKVGSNGAATIIGQLPIFRRITSTTQLNALVEISTYGVWVPTYAAGTVSSDGKYYYVAMYINGSKAVSLLSSPSTTTLTTDDVIFRLCWVDVSSSLPTDNPAGYYVIDYKTDSLMNHAMNQYLANLKTNVTNPGNAIGGMADFAINPTSHDIFSYFTYTDSAESSSSAVAISNTRGMLIKIAKSNDTTIKAVGVAPNNIPNSSPKTEMTGVVFSPEGNFYSLFNNGLYTQVDTTTGALASSTPTVTNSNLPLNDYNGNPTNLRGDMASGTTAVALPIKLLSFVGIKNKNYNTLNWTTALEENAKGFDVEKSVDGKSWSKIGFVASQSLNGNSDGKIQYTFDDNNVAEERSFYRLKLIDLDGVYTYSSVIIINNDLNSTEITVSPNPATSYINVSSVNQAYTFTLTNSLGQLVSKKEVAANSTFTYNVTDLSSGMYFYNIYLNGISKKAGQIAIRK